MKLICKYAYEESNFTSFVVLIRWVEATACAELEVWGRYRVYVLFLLLGDKSHGIRESKGLSFYFSY